MLLLKHFITKVLEYKPGLKGRIEFVCIAMYSLVMSLCSHDLHVTSLNNNYCNSRLTVVQLTRCLFLDGTTLTCYKSQYHHMLIVYCMLVITFVTN